MVENMKTYKKGLVVFNGNMGAGKTYGMVREVFCAWNEGIHVFSIMSLYPPEKYKKLYHKISVWDVEKFLETAWEYPVILVLDEGWILFDSYVLTKLELETRIQIVSARKHNINIYLTSQRFMAVHTALRELVDTVRYCESYSFLFFQLHRNLKYEIKNGTGQLSDESSGAEIFFFRRKIANCYNTLETIWDMFPKEWLYRRDKKYVVKAVPP